jgi:hypothetical protein
LDDPFSAKNLVATGYMAIVAGAGGLVNFYQKVKTGKARAFNIPEFIGEVVVSAAVGIVTYWVCKGLEINEYLTVAGVAITGHMGARAIFVLESKAEDLVKQWGPK